LGQFYLQFSKFSGKTMRELGEIMRTDPELYEFMEAGFASYLTRLKGGRPQ